MPEFLQKDIDPSHCSDIDSDLQVSPAVLHLFAYMTTSSSLHMTHLVMIRPLQAVRLGLESPVVELH